MWTPKPGLTEGQWKSEAATLGAVGPRGHNGQLWGVLQPGDKGYDPQKAADYDAMLKYGKTQGWVQPHKASFGGAIKQGVKDVGPVALAALGGYGLSTLGAGAAGATTGVSGSGLGGASGTVSGLAAPGAASTVAPGLAAAAPVVAAAPAIASAAPVVAGAAPAVAGVAPAAAAAPGFFGTANAVLGTALGANALFGDPLGLGGEDGSDASNLAASISADQWAHYKKNYQPLEASLIKQAMEAGSPEEFARARGAANADVTGAFDQVQKQTQSRMQEFGINPSSPRYQNTASSIDIGEGTARAGALTSADNRTRDLAWAKGLDMVSIGRGIPATASSNSLAAGNSQFLQNRSNMQNTGAGLTSLVDNAGKLYGSAKTWFGPSSSTPAQQTAAMNSGWSSPDYFGDEIKLKDGGHVDLLKSRGFSDDAMKIITPHMRGLNRYANGGDVGLNPIDNESGQVIGPGTGTSDSVPAEIDGQQPAALSSGEFVINQAAVEMTGSEILEAINRAGLEKRGQPQRALGGLEPKMQGNPPPAYRHGGRVHYRHGGKVCYGLGA